MRPNVSPNDDTRKYQQPGKRGIPRVVDAVTAGIGLIMSAPLLMVAAFAVWVSSPGPILFRQPRVGLNGRLFILLKFRSMRIAEEGLQVTAGDDRRITPVGRFLRKSKLDEMPELWNVLRGDMAFVGPRPEVPKYVDLSDIRWQRVLSVRPGLTDPVTLRLRNEEALLSDVKGDREHFYQSVLSPWKLYGYQEYLMSRSFRTDVCIIIKTIIAIFDKTNVQQPTQEELAEFRDFHESNIQAVSNDTKREGD